MENPSQIYLFIADTPIFLLGDENKLILFSNADIIQYFYILCVTCVIYLKLTWTKLLLLVNRYRQVKSNTLVHSLSSHNDALLFKTRNFENLFLAKPRSLYRANTLVIKDIYHKFDCRTSMTKDPVLQKVPWLNCYLAHTSKMATYNSDIFRKQCNSPLMFWHLTWPLIN